MNNLIDKIDAYLDGTMSPEEAAAFETQMKSDAALREQVTTQQNLRAGIERLGMKAATASAFKKITLKNKLYKWGAATIAVAAIATSAYLMTTSPSVDSEANITYELPATNEEGGTQWADADRNLPTQLFTINPAKDTVIETMGGIVFAIPAGAFVNAKDPMTLEIREALTPMDIMKAGLSTTSNGELLETGGMFYLNARDGETSLALNPDKPVYANIPTNEIRPNMQLFEGERTADGGINWVNPKQIEKQLIPVDIFSLNFYPEGFEEKCAELGFDANDKKVTDSVYYSYAGRSGIDSLIAVMAPMEIEVAQNIAPDGEALFNANCSSCHTTTKRATTGPGLAGVLDRIPGGNWRYDYVHNSSAVHMSGDPYAAKLREQYKTAMTSFPMLSNADIDAILMFADNWGHTPHLEIDPARIAAIHTAEFQNTLIATKEFEERLQVIFRIGNPDILDLYVKNLDRKLYELDSVASTMTESSEFQEFYLRHDGGVAISQSHMQELQEYYQKKQEAVRIASEKTYNARTAVQRMQDSIYMESTTDYWNNNAKQSGENFTKEYDLNLKEAYRQLGIDPKAKAPAPYYYGFDVQQTGWANVDAFVFQSTATRTTLDYTDPATGKTAVIKYEELKVNIADESNYTQLMVYLVADQLPCFQKVNNVTGEYKENLNELMEYSLVVIGEKDGTWFSAITPKVTTGTVNVTLKSTDENSLRNTLNGTFSGKVGSDFSAEVSYMKKTHQFNVRKEKEKQQQAIDDQLMKVIFPFYSTAVFDPGFDDEMSYGQ